MFLFFKVFPEKILVSFLFLRKNLEKKKITFLTLEIYIYYIYLLHFTNVANYSIQTDTKKCKK